MVVDPNDSKALTLFGLYVGTIRRSEWWWAADELRSVNAQIEYLLKEAVRKSSRATTQSMREARCGKRDQIG